jgi:hypothetical protein
MTDKEFQSCSYEYWSDNHLLPTGCYTNERSHLLIIVVYLKAENASKLHHRKLYVLSNIFRLRMCIIFLFRRFWVEENTRVFG